MELIAMGLQPKSTVRTSVILTSEQYKRIAALAEHNDVSVAWVIRNAIGRFLDEHQDQLRLPLQLPRPVRGE